MDMKNTRSANGSKINGITTMDGYNSDASPATPESMKLSLEDSLSSCSLDSPNNTPSKQRKPYTVTKQRESWSPEEHKRFVEGVRLYKRDWKAIEKYVGTKTVIQIRSHAQKYFMKLQKANPDVSIPPARPKRPSPRLAKKNSGSGSGVSSPNYSFSEEEESGSEPSCKMPRIKELFHSHPITPMGTPTMPSSSSHAPSNSCGSATTVIPPSELNGEKESDKPRNNNVMGAVTVASMSSQPHMLVLPAMMSPNPPPSSTATSTSTATSASSVPTASLISSHDDQPMMIPQTINLQETPLLKEDFCSMPEPSTSSSVNPPQQDLSWSATPENLPVRENPVISNPTAFSQWMALNSYMFGTVCPNFMQAQGPEVQRMHLDQLQKAQQYIQQAAMVMLSQQQNNFESWIGNCSTDQVSLTDMPTHEIVPESVSKGYHPFEHERLNNNVLDQYYTLLGKQIEHIEKQIANAPQANPSSDLLSDQSISGDNFRMKLVDHNNDFFQHQFSDFN